MICLSTSNYLNQMNVDLHNNLPQYIIIIRYLRNTLIMAINKNTNLQDLDSARV